MRSGRAEPERRVPPRRVAPRPAAPPLWTSPQSRAAAFVIKTNDEPRVRSLLADPDLRARLALQPKLTLSVLDDEGWFGADFPEGVDELKFHAVGVIKDLVRLQELFELFAATLNRLCHIGSAYEDDPGIRL